jgi:hypothetical protein
MTEKAREATAIEGRGVGIGVATETLKSDLNANDGVVVNHTTKTITPIKDNRRHPDPAVAQTVANMVFAGMTQDTICRVLKMGLDTLHNHYKHELETGQAGMVNQISTSLAQRALSGSDTAAIFLLKTRGNGKFSERNALELTGKDGGPIEIEHRAAILTGLAGALEKGITIDGEVDDEKKAG